MDHRKCQRAISIPRMLRALRPSLALLVLLACAEACRPGSEARPGPESAECTLKASPPRPGKVSVFTRGPVDVELFLEPRTVFHRIDQTVTIRWEVRDMLGEVLEDAPVRLTWPNGVVPTGEPNTFRLMELGHQVFFVTVEGDADPPLSTSALVTVVEDLAEALQQQPDLDIPYVPTPMPVVNKMLELAEITGDDLVYDLGCGDGRLFVTAAARYDAKAVGVDLDLRRIADSRARARRKGVTGLVRFFHADLFLTDFKDATVLLMYLLPSVNLGLRPKILRYMEPGSRIVSHDFDMWDWEADHHERISLPESNHQVFMWVVPAQMEGVWEGELVRAGGAQPLRLAVDQDFQFAGGTLSWGEHTAEIEYGQLTGRRFDFKVEVPWDDGVERVHVSGEVRGDSFAAVAGRAGNAQHDPDARLIMHRTAAPKIPSYALDD